MSLPFAFNDILMILFYYHRIVWSFDNRTIWNIPLNNSSTSYQTLFPDSYFIKNFGVGTNKNCATYSSFYPNKRVIFYYGSMTNNSIVHYKSVASQFCAFLNYNVITYPAIFALQFSTNRSMWRNNVNHLISK